MRVAGITGPDLSRLREAARGAITAARERPSFALYLVAVLLFPFKWLSPFSHPQAGWIDVFIAVAAATWMLEQVRSRRRPRLRAPHWFGGAYLALGALSALLASSDRSVGAENVVIIVELGFLALLTSDFAQAPRRRSAIVLAILAVTLVTGVETIIALCLFYAGIETSLLNVYGAYFEPSSLYARVSAGFYNAALLGSFCIFASALLARDDAGIPRSWRRFGQCVLAVVVLLTFSRAVIGFALALIIRAAHSRGTRGAHVTAAAAAALAVTLTAGLTVGKFDLDPAHPASSRVTLAQVSDNPRLEGFTTSFDTLAKHPLLGSGPGSLPGEFDGEPFRAHFTPLNVAATMGFPAMLALVGLVIALWRQRRRPTDIATWSGLAGLGVDAIGQDVDHFRHVWIMFGFADADRRDPTR